ncbi:MAG: type IV pilin protein [Deltaproteobacteria bacterium]
MRTGRTESRGSEFGVSVPEFLYEPRNPYPESRGFTLLELMIVMTIILILATMAVPAYLNSVQRAREAVLRDDLYTMRSLIDQFTLDKNRPPQSLDELVDEHYLRGGIPVDPMTRTNDTWQTVTEDVAISPQQSMPGIVDVHSGSEEISLDGTPYSSW